MAAKVFRIELLPALHGDCIWIEYGEPPGTHHVLIDGGPLGAFDALRTRVARCDGSRRLELFVITHVDGDHIEGAVKLLNQDQLGMTFRDIWFNGWEQLRRTLPRAARTVPAKSERSPAQGHYLALRLEGRKEAWNRWFYGGAIMVPDQGPLPRVTLDGGLELTLLSPNAAKLEKLRKEWVRSLRAIKARPENTELFRKRLNKDVRYRGAGAAPIAPDSVAQAVAAEVKIDDSAANGSSIALLAEYGCKRCAFLGDAHMDAIEPALARLPREHGVKRLPLDAVKLSHHGSEGNITRSFLAAIDCRRFLISTNGKQFDHPDDAAIECILAGTRAPQLYFNYKSPRNEQWDDEDRKRARGYSTVYPAPGKAGLCLDLLGPDDLPKHQH